MATNTPRFDLGRFDAGENGWDHTDTVNLLDEYSINRGPIADRPTSGDYDDQMYYATDQGLLWRWDSTASDWTTDNFGTDTEPVPGTSHFSDLFSNSLTTGDIDAVNVNGDAFGLPSGWTLTENTNGEAVFEDSGGNVVLRRDATNGEWVTDTVNADSISTGELTVSESLDATGLNAPQDNLITFISHTDDRDDGFFRDKVKFADNTGDNTPREILDVDPFDMVLVMAIRPSDGADIYDIVRRTGGTIDEMHTYSDVPVSYSFDSGFLQQAIDGSGDKWRLGVRVIGGSPGNSPF